MFKFAGQRPNNLGVTEGKLAACPSSPNCVSSQTPESDAVHAIQPFPYAGNPAEAIAKLKTIIEAMPRTEIIQTTDNYLYAEFTSQLMGYVDDVEFYVEASAGLLHVRSASRLGKSDLGANRKRIEAIRAEFT